MLAMSNFADMKNKICIMIDGDALAIIVSSGGSFQIEGLSERDQKCLQDYFSLLRDEYQDDLSGLNQSFVSPFVVNALIQHISWILESCSN